MPSLILHCSGQPERTFEQGLVLLDDPRMLQHLLVEVEYGRHRGYHLCVFLRVSFLVHVTE